MGRTSGSDPVLGAVAVIIFVSFLLSFIGDSLMHWLVVPVAIVVMVWVAKALNGHGGGRR